MSPHSAAASGWTDSFDDRLASAPGVEPVVVLVTGAVDGVVAEGGDPTSDTARIANVDSSRDIDRTADARIPAT